MRQVKEININLVKPRRPKRLLDLSGPLQSNKPILVEKKRKYYVIIDGHHRYYKNIEIGSTKCLVEVK